MGSEGMFPGGRGRGIRICVAGLAGCVLGAGGPVAAAADEFEPASAGEEAGVSWGVRHHPAELAEQVAELRNPRDGMSNPRDGGVSWARWTPGEKAGTARVPHRWSRRSPGSSPHRADTPDQPVRLKTTISPDRLATLADKRGPRFVTGRQAGYLVTVAALGGTARQVRLHLIVSPHARWADQPRGCRLRSGASQLVCALGTVRGRESLPVVLEKPRAKHRDVAITAVVTAANAARTVSGISSGARMRYDRKDWLDQQGQHGQKGQLDQQGRLPATQSRRVDGPDDAEKVRSLAEKSRSSSGKPRTFRTEPRKLVGDPHGLVTRRNPADTAAGPIRKSRNHVQEPGDTVEEPRTFADGEPDPSEESPTAGGKTSSSSGKSPSRANKHPVTTTRPRKKRPDHSRNTSDTLPPRAERPRTGSPQLPPASSAEPPAISAPVRPPADPAGSPAVPAPVRPPADSADSVEPAVPPRSAWPEEMSPQGHATLNPRSPSDGAPSDGVPPDTGTVPPASTGGDGSYGGDRTGTASGDAMSPPNPSRPRSNPAAPGAGAAPGQVPGSAPGEVLGGPNGGASNAPGAAGPVQPSPASLLPSLAPPPGGTSKPKPAPPPSAMVATPVGAPDRQSHWATLIAMVAFAQSALLWLAVTLFLRYRRLVREGVGGPGRRAVTPSGDRPRGNGAAYAGLSGWLRTLVRRH